MKLNKKTLPFERLLEAYISKDSNQFNASTLDKEAEVVFSTQYSATLPEAKIEALVSSLAQNLSKETLGSLIASSLEVKNTPIVELQQKTGLTPSLLEAIKNDMVFTNSIPIKSLVKLLKFLELPLDKVKSSIEQTFNRLNTENKILFSVPPSTQPSFRKGAEGNNFGSDLLRLKSDESYLYQNKDALDKYTTRLTELFNEI
jgi:hypothetical protein